jgi:hypothetical protein
MKTGLFAIAVLISGNAVGAYSSPEEESAYACARSAQQETSQSAFEVVRMTQRSGDGNFRFWMNTHDEQLGVYCETAGRQVTRIFAKAEPWQQTKLYRPRLDGIAAK